MLIVTCGLPGSGKSYFASHLAKALQIPHFKSDDVRDALQQRGSYDAQTKAMVYEALLNKALTALDEYPAAVADATFHKAWMQQMANNLAGDQQVALKYIQLVADEVVVKERVSRQRPDSDADLSVYRELQQEADPLQQDHLTLDSGAHDLNTNLERAYQYLNLFPTPNSGSYGLSGG